jgi:ribosomal protein L36
MVDVCEDCDILRRVKRLFVTQKQARRRNTYSGILQRDSKCLRRRHLDVGLSIYLDVNGPNELDGYLTTQR